MRRITKSIISFLAVATLTLGMTGFTAKAACIDDNAPYIVGENSFTQQLSGADGNVSKKVTLYSNDIVSETIKVSVDYEEAEVPAQSSANADVVLLFDCSGSMEFGNQNQTLKHIKVKAKNYVEKLLKNSDLSIGVISFDSKAHVMGEVSSDLKTIEAQIEAVNVIDDNRTLGTNAQAGLHEADLMLGENTTGGTIVVIADGKVNRSYVAGDAIWDGNADHGRTRLLFGNLYLGQNGSMTTYIDRYLLKDFDYSNEIGYSGSFSCGTRSYTLKNADASKSVVVDDNGIATISEAYLIKAKGRTIITSFFKESYGKQAEYVMKNVASAPSLCFEYTKNKQNTINELFESLENVGISNTTVENTPAPKTVTMSLTDEFPSYLEWTEGTQISVVRNNDVQNYTYAEAQSAGIVANGKLNYSCDIDCDTTVTIDVNGLTLNRDAMEAAYSETIANEDNTSFDAAMNTKLEIVFSEDGQTTGTDTFENAPALTFEIEKEEVIDDVNDDPEGEDEDPDEDDEDFDGGDDDPDGDDEDTEVIDDGNDDPDSDDEEVEVIDDGNDDPDSDDEEVEVIDDDNDDPVVVIEEEDPYVPVVLPEEEKNPYVPVVLPPVEEIEVVEEETPAAPVEEIIPKEEPEEVVDEGEEDPEVIEIIEITIPEIPEALPQTGTLPAAAYFGIGASLIGAGVVVLRKKD